MRTLSIVALVACGLVAQAQSTSTLSISGNSNGMAVNSGFSFTLQGTGTLSGVGSGVFFTSGNVVSVSALTVTSTITGTFSLIFPEGDVISGTILIPAGLLIPSLGQTTGATATITMTGGTGRFANAAGSYLSFAISGTNTGQGTGTFQGSGSGTLSTPAYHVAGTVVYSGSMAHLASGGGWKTTIILTNNGSASAQARLNFFDENGLPLVLPFTFPQSSASASNSTLNATLQPGAEFIVESQATTTIAGLGSAQLFTDGAVTGFLIFRFVPTGQEASVPLQTGNAGSYVLSFDASAPGFNTGIAVANVAASTAAIPVVFRDDAGNVLASDTITLNPQGHLSFVVTTNYPSTVGKRGTVVFQTPSGGQISAIAIRAVATTFTTIPAATK